jgi:hypothetical protein
MNERLGGIKKEEQNEEARVTDLTVQKPRDQITSKKNTRKGRANLSTAQLNHTKTRDKKYQQDVRQKTRQRLKVLEDEVQKNRETFSKLRRQLEGMQQILLL